MRFPDTLDPCQDLKRSDFFPFANLKGICDLKCISLITNEKEHLLMCFLLNELFVEMISLFPTGGEVVSLSLI